VPEPSAPVAVRRRMLRRVLVVLAVGLLLGAVGGVVWEWVWTPPTGAAYKGRWMPDAQGITHVADSTGWFVVIGLTYGILYGTFTTRYAKGLEIATMLGVLAGSLLAAWATLRVGAWLGPDDASVLARTMGDLEPLVLDLTLGSSGAGWWPAVFGSPVVLAPAVGAMMSVVAMYLCTDATGSSRRRRRSLAGERRRGRA
jgi:hypothetical protein